MKGLRGFSLVEAMIGLVTGGFLVTIVLQALSSQGQFFRNQSSREANQQNVRAAFDLIAGDLRAVPAGGGLVRASRDSVTVRVPRVWGVVCGVRSGSRLDVIVPVVAGLSYAVNAGTGAVLATNTFDDPVWSTSAGVSGIGEPSERCDTEVVPAGAERRTLALTALPSVDDRPVAAGDLIYLFDLVTYRSAPSSGGVWIQRRIGDGGSATNQPMAGPLSREGGLSFEYFVGGSSQPAATPILDPVTRDNVDRVAVVIRSYGSDEERAVGGDAGDTILISLANRGQ